jgi:hypothetical protein
VSGDQAGDEGAGILRQIQHNDPGECGRVRAASSGKERATAASTIQYGMPGSPIQSCASRKTPLLQSGVVIRHHAPTYPPIKAGHSARLEMENFDEEHDPGCLDRP